MQNTATSILASRERDVTRLASELSHLLKAAGDNSFLIVSAGAPYVQFLALPKQQAVSFEAVGTE